MQPEDRVRVRHLVDAAMTAREFVEGRERGDLDVLWATVTEDLPMLLSVLPNFNA